MKQHRNHAGEPQVDKDRGDRGSASLVAVIGLFLVALGLVFASLTVNLAGMEHSGQVREDMAGRFLVLAGFNHAFSEIKSQLDNDGDGGIGSVRLRTLTTQGNQVVGEYQAFIVNVEGVNSADLSDYNHNANNPFYVVRVLAAIPSFAAPQLRYMAEAEVSSNTDFILKAKTGAISISGPLSTNPDLSYWNSPGFSIDGTDNSDPSDPSPALYPAIVFTDTGARDNFMDDLEANWFNYNLDTKISGEPLTEYVGGTNTFDAPVTVEDDTAFTADMLNDYRDALRNYAHSLAAITETGSGTDLTGTVDYSNVDAGFLRAADYGIPEDVLVLHEHADVKDGAGAGQPRITQDLSGAEFGIAGVSTKTVLVDSSMFYQGGDSMSDNHDRTLTGAGTLIIMHPIGSRTDNNNGKQFNLNWEGDVFVIGYPKDRSTGVGQNSRTDNLLYLSRADWTIDGNLMVLTAGSTEASLEMQGTNANKANLNLTGSLLMFAEATGNEAEIDIESHANFTVNGLVGVYGSRIELENQSSTNTNWTINGTLAIGLPDNNTRGDDMRLKVRGNADFNFHLDNVETASQGLSELQDNLTFSNNQLVSLEFSSLGMVITPHPSITRWDQWQLVELPIVQGLPNGERGIILTLFD